MRKYKGPYLTRMRVRIKNGENIMVSKVYKGHIHHSQFSVPDSSFLLEILQEADKNTIYDWFYGSQLDEKYWSKE